MRIIIFTMLLTLLSGTAFGDDAVDPFNYQYKVSVSSRIFRNLSSQEMSSAFNIWATTALKGKIHDNNVSTSIFDNQESLNKLLKNGESDCYVIPSMDIDLRFLSPKNVLLPIKGGDKFTQYVVLVKEDCSIENLADLKNKKVVFYEAYDMSLAKAWLEHTLKSAETNNVKIWPLGLTTTDKPMEGIYKVFFGQSDAVVVSTNAYKTACLLNPQLGKNLKILVRSPNLIPMAFVFDPKLKSKRQDLLKESILAMHHTPGGKQVLTIFGCSQVEEHPITVMDETFAFLKEASPSR